MRDRKQLAQPPIPFARVDVEEHRAAGVRVVGRMHAPLGEIPDEPRIHGAEQQVARLRCFTRAFNVIQDPSDLARRKIGIGNKARARTDLFHDGLVLLQLIDRFRCSATLPYDRIVNRLTRMAIPHDGCLALIGNADAIDILRTQPLRNEQFGEHFELARKDVFGIMLHPTRMREYLREGALRDRPNGSAAIHQHCSR